VCGRHPKHTHTQTHTVAKQNYEQQKVCMAGGENQIKKFTKMPKPTITSTTTTTTTTTEEEKKVNLYIFILIFTIKSSPLYI